MTTNDTSYPTMKHRWLHDKLNYGIIQANLGVKHHPKSTTVDVLRRIFVDSLELYEEILSSPTKEKEEAG